ncbi:hypothetical protein MY11210_004364 [Beauveria gryllotalpidicola]
MSDLEDDGILNIEFSDVSQRSSAQDAAVAKNQEHVKLPLLCRAAPAKWTSRSCCTPRCSSYFFRRYNEAAIFAAQILQGKSRTALDSDSRRLLSKYHAKCKVKQAALEARASDI